MGHGPSHPKFPGSACPGLVLGRWQGWDVELLDSPEEAKELLQGLEPLCSGARLGELGVFTWRREGSRESSVPKGAPGELERDLGQGMEGQDTGNGCPLPEVSQRSCGCPWIPGSVQGQPGWGLEQKQKMDTGCDTAEGVQNCGLRPSYESFQKTGKRIGTGTDVKPGEFPWLVSIQSHGKHICGGTIISALWILTAAHCFADELAAQAQGGMTFLPWVQDVHLLRVTGHLFLSNMWQVQEPRLLGDKYPVAAQPGAAGWGQQGLSSQPRTQRSKGSRPFHLLGSDWVIYNLAAFMFYLCIPLPWESSFPRIDLSIPLEEHNPDSLILHEEFNRTSLQNDIALILLSNPIEFSTEKIPTCLPFVCDMGTWKHCWAAGWESTNAFSDGRWIPDKVPLPTSLVNKYIPTPPPPTQLLHIHQFPVQGKNQSPTDPQSKIWDPFPHHIQTLDLFLAPR
ncbi:hypothetical protein DV515_00013051 [Chloebia gouldiae]|uniref:Peptidase S1 domain-containing protein n=1 Tax=Chloebia gouldiae TaxID=44316 RepID=A0A3L8S3B5_CHLGU|nr:hypothetical protein DV515_00013051 [Chloebia gouldiae]